MTAKVILDCEFYTISHWRSYV